MSPFELLETGLLGHVDETFHTPPIEFVFAGSWLVDDQQLTWPFDNFATHVKDRDQNDIRPVLKHVVEINGHDLPPFFAEHGKLVPIINSVGIPPMGDGKVM